MTVRDRARLSQELPFPPVRRAPAHDEVREAAGGTISEYAIYTAVVDPSDVTNEQEAVIGANNTSGTADTDHAGTMNDGRRQRAGIG